MKNPVLLLALALALPVSAQTTVKLSTDAKGVVVDAGSAGRITLAAPIINGNDGKARKPSGFTPGPDGLSAKAVYEDGFAIDIALSAEGDAIHYRFDGPPANAKSINISASLPLSYAESGAYAVNGGESAPFPAVPDKQLFAQGAFTRVDLLAAPGEGLSFTVPVSYQQLQDNRIWKTRSFSWIYRYDLARYPESKGFVFQVSLLKK